MRQIGKDTLHFYVATPSLSHEPRSAISWRAIGKQFTVIGVLFLTDIAAIALAFTTAVSVRLWLGNFLGNGFVTQPHSLSTIGYILLLWPALLWREGLYPGYGLTGPQQLRKLVTASFYAGTLFATATVFFYRDLLMPRGVLILMALLSMVFLPLGRSLVKRLLLSFRLWGSHVVVLGAGEAGQRVVKALKLNPLEGLHPVALFDDDEAKISKDVEGIRIVGPLAEAEGFAKARGIQHAVVAIPSMPSEALLKMIKQNSKRFKFVRFVPELGSLPAEDIKPVNLDGLLAFEMRNGLYSRRNQMIKRAMDVAGSLLGGLLLAPILGLLYLWVRLDSRGPAFHRSERVGQDGKRFMCLKFRSMHVDAEQRLDELLSSNPRLCEEYQRYHKLENDPRITRAGRILRKLSLDELPQLFNVLSGQMSLIGPRPYMFAEVKDMEGFTETIFEVKPGLTGYWQVSGRNNVTFYERLVMESHYVHSWSIWWDILILCATLPAVFQREGAK